MTAMKITRLVTDKTVRDVALAIGVSPAHYSNIEIGVREPDQPTALRIEKYFGAPIAALLQPPIIKLRQKRARRASKTIFESDK
jgi:transcriptional regulator with XRE-family HTH domain